MTCRKCGLTVQAPQPYEVEMELCAACLGVGETKVIGAIAVRRLAPVKAHGKWWDEWEPV